MPGSCVKQKKKSRAYTYLLGLFPRDTPNTEYEVFQWHLFRFHTALTMGEKENKDNEGKLGKAEDYVDKEEED